MATDRVVLPGGIASSALATIATFLHFDRFNQDSPFAFARGITWVWLIAYPILPPLLLAFWPGQVRARVRLAPGREVRLAPRATLKPRSGVWLIPERRSGTGRSG
jgi:hypothetical protein